MRLIVSAYALCQDRGSMPADPRLKSELCNCLALRQATRHVTQFYDQCLAPAGLRTTQFSILARLRRLGPVTISALAADLVMDRTTLGRNLQPLEREGLVAVARDAPIAGAVRFGRPIAGPSGSAPPSKAG